MQLHLETGYTSMRANGSLKRNRFRIMWNVLRPRMIPLGQPEHFRPIPEDMWKKLAVAMAGR